MGLSLNDIQKLIDKRVKIIEGLQATRKKLDAEKRDPTDAERQEWDKGFAECDSLKDQIEQMHRDYRAEAEAASALAKEQEARRGGSWDGYARLDELQRRLDAGGRIERPDDPASRGASTGRAGQSGKLTMMRERFVDGNGKELRTFGPGERMARGNGLSLGRMLAALVKRDWSGAEPEFRALQGSTDTAGGFLLNEEMSAIVIDAVRAQSVAFQRTTVVPMAASELAVAKLETDIGVGWSAENVARGDDSPTFGRMTLRARTCRAHIPVSEELIQDAADLPSVLANACTAALASKLDAAIVNGGGDGDQESPKGLRTISGLNELSAIGAPTYDDFLDAMKEVEIDNIPPGGRMQAILHPRDLNTLAKLKEATTNAYLAPPARWSELDVLTTTAVSATEGAGSDSYAILGRLDQVIVGMRLAATIVVGGPIVGSPSQYQRSIVCVLRADVAVPRPQHFCRLVGITT